MTKPQVAALAPMVIQAWLEGDAVAADVVDEGVNEVSRIAEAAAQKLELAKPLICYTGGLIENSPQYRQAIIKQIESRIAGATMVPPVLTPALGAILLAYEMTGSPHQAATWQKLQQTYAKTKSPQKHSDLIPFLG